MISPEPLVALSPRRCRMTPADIVRDRLSRHQSRIDRRRTSVSRTGRNVGWPLHWDPARHSHRPLSRQVTLLASAGRRLQRHRVAVFLLTATAATNTREVESCSSPAAIAVSCIVHLPPLGKDVDAATPHPRTRSQAPGLLLLSHVLPLSCWRLSATHLFGGLAGREGTAGSRWGKASPPGLRRRIGLDRSHPAHLLMTGIAPAFGSVFRDSIAGLVLRSKSVHRPSVYDSLIPCIIGIQVGDWTCTAWGRPSHALRRGDRS